MGDKGNHGDRIIADIRREDITSEKLNKIFQTWSSTYDQDVDQMGYNAYGPPVEKLCDLYPEDTRGRVRVLDVGAGTGLLGLGLKNAGFVLIDGLDPSKEMMEEAKKRNVYQNYIIEYLTENPLAIKQDTYDVVVGSGIFSTAHVPYTSIYEMIRLTKPGGHVVLSMREMTTSLPEYSDMEPMMDRLEREGVWTRLCKTIFPGYFKDVNGALYVFRIQ